MSNFVTYYRGVPIFIDDNGCYLVEDGNQEFYYPTEEEAKEHIDDELGL